MPLPPRESKLGHYPDFELLARKAVRVVAYRGRNRTETLNEQVETRGYAAGFAGLVNYMPNICRFGRESQDGILCDGYVIRAMIV